MIVAPAAAATVLLAADVVGGGFDPYAQIASTGVTGAVIVLFLMGKLYPVSVVRRLEAQLKQKDDIIEKKDDLLAKLNASLADRAVPALTRSAQAIERLHEQRP